MCAFPPLVSCKKTRQAPNVKFTALNKSETNITLLLPRYNLCHNKYTPLCPQRKCLHRKKIKLTTMYSKTFKIRVPLILRLTSLLELSLNILSLVLLRMYLEQIFTVSLPKLLCKVTPQVDINILSVRTIIMGYHLLTNPVFLLALNKKNQKDSSQTQLTPRVLIAKAQLQCIHSI